jgi:Tfp pilus assembly protein PilO
MKNDRVLIIVMAVIAAVAVVWAVRLNGSYNTLENKKIELEDKLSQALKDKDFLRAQLSDLEKKLDARAQENNILAQQLEEAKNTIEEFQQEILRLTESKSKIENQLNSLMENKTGDERPVQAEVINPSVPALPTTPQTAQETNSPAPENLMPLTQ